MRNIYSSIDIATAQSVDIECGLSKKRMSVIGYRGCGHVDVWAWLWLKPRVSHHQMATQ